MTMLRYRRSSLLALILCLGLPACGGGHTVGGGTTLNLAGNWQATTRSNFGFSTFLAGTLSQSGNQISGTLTISGSPCAVSGALAGTVSGTSVNLSLNEGGQSVTIAATASADGNSMTGTYQAPLGGCTNGDSGTFSATRQTSTLGCAPVPPGIVSWWRGEGNAQDQTGSNPGTLQGGVTFGSGKVGQAFSFDGSTGYVNVTDSPSLEAILTTVSVEMWANSQSLPANAVSYLYARRNPIFSENFSMYIKADGTLGILLRTTSSPTPTGSKFESIPGTVAFGTFEHIAATANTNSGVVKAYVNGVAVPLTVVFGPATLSGTFVSVPYLYLGRREDAGVEGQAGAGYFAGSLDEISLYSAELTQTQIQTIVSAGSSGKCQ